jgi:hypothetical protein
MRAYLPAAERGWITKLVFKIVSENYILLKKTAGGGEKKNL